MLAAFVLLTGISIALIGHEAIRTTEITLTGMLAGNLAQAVLGKIESTVYEPALRIVSAMSRSALPEAVTREKRRELLPWLSIFMLNYPIMDGARVGYGNGDYLALRRLSGGEIIEHKPPDGSAFMFILYEHGNGGTTLTIFFDEDMNALAKHSDAGKANYDARASLWYRRALDSEEAVETGPILTPISRQPAVTFSQSTSDGETVVGVDIVLTRLSRYLERIRPTPGANIGIFREGVPIAGSLGRDDEGDWVATPLTRGEMTPILEMGFRRYEAGERGLDIDFDASKRGEWVLFLDELNPGGEISNAVVLAIPQEEILDASVYFPRRVALVSLGLLIASSPFLYMSARFIFSPLRKLATHARKVKNNPLIKEDRVVSNVAEIHDLAEGMEYMQTNIQTLLSITGTINREKDFPNMITRILDEIMHMANSDGGGIVLLPTEYDEQSGGVACWNPGSEEPSYFEIELRHLDELHLPAPTPGKLSLDFIDRSSPRADAYFLSVGFEDPGTTGIEVLYAPLFGRMGEPLGKFVLARRIRSPQDGFRPHQQGLIEGLARTAAIALDNHRLFEKQRMLLDAVIQVIAGAIDAKSPHTSKHCERVPIIFQMLLQAACETEEGPLADFTLSENDWEEARIAAWLHDWGKVTTPEFVIDKAMKLDTMYNRIHEIRMRFEVVKRDAEIGCLNAILDGGDEGEEREKLQAALRELDGDFAFVADCNRGDAESNDSVRSRLTQIASRTWLRTLDNSLGISREELDRLQQDGILTTPSIEVLISDRPEHLIEHTPGSLIPPDNPWGIHVTPLRYLYNRGELYNLRIPRGTITEEERFKINDHITQTIIMLDKVPLPRHLKNVSEIAGAHHETMDGTGYPRNLVRGEMSWRARMLAVADIFEALTASDRPYKPYNTLSESIRILEKFMEDDRIDKDVLELFLRSGIPREYARKYLRPEQNDLP